MDTNTNNYFERFNSLDSTDYDNYISGGIDGINRIGSNDDRNTGYLLNVLYKDTEDFNRNNQTYFTFKVPDNSPGGDYQIFLAGTWFGRIQEEYITILTDTFEEVDIKFDSNYYEEFKNFAWHRDYNSNTGDNPIVSKRLYIRTLPRLNGNVYYWAMNPDPIGATNYSSPFKIALTPGRTYKIRGFTNYDDAGSINHSSKYDKILFEY